MMWSLTQQAALVTLKTSACICLAIEICSSLSAAAWVAYARPLLSVHAALPGLHGASKHCMTSPKGHMQRTWVWGLQ